MARLLLDGTNLLELDAAATHLSLDGVGANGAADFVDAGALTVSPTIIQTTSYGNKGGRANRTKYMSATDPVFGDASKLIDGNENYSGSIVYIGSRPVGSRIIFNLNVGGEAIGTQVIDEVTIRSNVVEAGTDWGTIQFRGSHDGVTWRNLGAATLVSGSDSLVIPIAIPGNYSYYDILHVGAQTTGIVNIYEVWFKISGEPEVSVVSVGNCKSQSFGTSVTPVLPTGRVNGNLLIGLINKNTGTQGVPLVWPSDWTVIATQDSGGTQDCSASIAIRYIDGTETDPTITWTGNASAVARVIQVGGVIDFNPIGAISVTATDASATITEGGITAERPNSVAVVIAVGHTVTTTMSLPAGYSVMADTCGGIGGANTVWSQQLEDAGDTSDPVSSTAGNSSDYACFSIELCSISGADTFLVPFDDQSDLVLSPTLRVPLTLAAAFSDQADLSLVAQALIPVPPPPPPAVPPPVIVVIVNR